MDVRFQISLLDDSATLWMSDFKYHCWMTAPHCGCQISNSNPRLLTLLFKLLSKSDNACYCLYPLMVLPSVACSIPWRPDRVKATLSFVTISDEMLCTVIRTERVFVWVTSPDRSKAASNDGRCGQTQSFRPVQSFLIAGRSVQFFVSGSKRASFDKTHP